MPATVLHFVRHCDVENPDGLVYGRLPGFGQVAIRCAQAERVAAFLSRYPISVIYSSPQLRARQTARAIQRASPHAPLRLSQRLAEVFTSYQGMKVRDIPSTVNMFDNPKDPGDESMADVLRRMKQFIAHVRRRHVGGEIVCVSHAAPISILRVHLERRPLTVSALRGPGEPQKGSVTTIVVDDLSSPAIRYLTAYDVETHAVAR